MSRVRFDSSRLRHYYSRMPRVYFKNLRLLFVPEVFWKALAGTCLLLLACLPYLIFKEVRLLYWKLGLLFPALLVMWQFHFAWTPAEVRAGTPLTACRDRQGRYFLLAWIPLLLVQIGLVDPLMSQALPVYAPESAREFWVTLPWVAGFMSLFGVAWVYALGARLFKTHFAGLLLVVLFNQLLAAMQYHRSTTGIFLLVTTLVGIKGLFLGVAFEYTGFLGLALVQGLFWSRFALYLI